MDIPYILLVDDFPRNKEDSDSSMKAHIMKNRSQLEAWAKDHRAPTLQIYSKVVLEHYDTNQERFEKVVPKEFKYSDALDKAAKTDNYSEWHELQQEGGTELEQAMKKSHEEHPDWKDRIRQHEAEIIWELGFTSRIENGTLPPLTNDPDEDPEVTH